MEPLDTDSELGVQAILPAWLRESSPDSSSWLDDFSLRALEVARATPHTTFADRTPGPQLPQEPPGLTHLRLQLWSATDPLTQRDIARRIRNTRTRWQRRMTRARLDYEALMGWQDPTRTLLHP